MNVYRDVIFKLRILPWIVLFTFVGCKAESNKAKDDESKTVEELKKDLEKKEEIMIFEDFEHYATLTSMNEIKNAFGAENCKDGISHYAEGTIKVKHTLVKNLKNKQQVKYVWNQKDPSKLDFIEASHKIYDADYNVLGTQSIGSGCGMHLGMSINELVAWNEKNFEFSGFGWDYEGTVIAPDNSRLDNCKVKITLGMDEKANTDKFMSLYGDQLLNSSNSLVKSAPIFVATFTLYIGDQDK